MEYQRSFLFDHLPKTGGTAFRAVLEQIFGVNNVSPWISGRSELWARQRYADYAVITGHFHSPVPVDVPANGRARITILRDPIDRAVSEYFYYRNDVERVEWNKLAILAKDHDLHGYVKLLQANRDTAISNLYSRRFASQLSRLLWSDRKVLELAKAALDRYDFVGIQEQFADSVDMFCCTFRLPPVSNTANVNVTSSRGKLHDLDCATRETLVEMNRLDVELYAYARQRFEDSKRKIFHSYAGGGIVDSVRTDPQRLSETTAARMPDSFGDRSVEIRDARVIGCTNGTNTLRSGDQTTICLAIKAHIDVPELTAGIEISDELGEIVFGTNTHLVQMSRSVSAGQTYQVEFVFAANMKHGRYFVGASLHTGATHEDRCFDWRDRIATFDVVDDAAYDFVGYCRLAPTVRWRSDDGPGVSLQPAHSTGP